VDDAGLYDPDSYLPAYVRRYPFVFANDQEGERLIVCIDTGADAIGEQPEHAPPVGPVGRARELRPQHLDRAAGIGQRIEGRPALAGRGPGAQIAEHLQELGMRLRGEDGCEEERRGGRRRQGCRPEHAAIISPGETNLARPSHNPGR
jgi:hypothetical protein